ncbi:MULTISPECIES: GlxA family transcriptional regulator [Streptomyces]|uniref:AraC family transcriptional regulator n=2 Tax=Streptomyces nigrescens TaxID=1920 RepID=A0A640TEC7_STRNI|nr:MULTISPECIES: helix-turn-helix domain-containing protein [Streptomyces]WAT96068.1 helix-turn-helix domain-containing protein [Streptomyces libani subsp. libani]WAU03690.1 helix-turn-helix domain-containing protein [Streptomyces nigrescens]WDT58208.1 helix-turn-helix domain-containing protein [Streptomyces sp. G7(2002)]GFE21392.1 AraC family transcriptional regulator [Streptomyces libani subsp. libani]GGW02356.1 AraC family transcriptional regulator [Streptomyces libani subsp. libani]
MHTVAILALEDVAAFDLTIPCQVFAMAHGPDGSPAYEVRVCAGRTVTATAGRHPSFRISSPYGLDDARDADTVIVPGVRPDRAPSPRALRLIREVADRGGRVASICTGAFVLAKAGLLDGRRATTHWMFAGQLAQRFPDVEVDPSVLFVDNGQILTSAGVAAGLDLCLHMVRRDLGAAAAARTARMIVMAPQRAGGQAQFIEHRDPPSNTDHLGPVLEWMQENLDKPLTVADIARRAAMSSRSLSRRFRAQTGTTPLQWLLHRRLQRARELLETTDLSMERVARAAGFGSTETLRHHFSRHVGTTPTAYRATFQSC